MKLNSMLDGFVMKHAIDDSVSRRPAPGWRTVVVFLMLLAAVARAAEAELPPLTTVENNPRLPGKFIWADLVTDDVTKARNFYSRVFGWQFWSM